MTTCICGNSVENGKTQCAWCAALHTLGLERGATQDAIKDAHRLLVKVWHPDRFQTDKKLRDAANAKLKEVNSAFKFLTSTPLKGKGYEQRSPDEPVYATYQTVTPTKEHPENQSDVYKATPTKIPYRVRFRRLVSTVKIISKIAALAFFVLLVRYTWIAFEAPDPTNGQLAEVYSFGKEYLLKELETPRMRFIHALLQDLRRLDPRASASESGSQAAQSAPSTDKHSTSQKKNSQLPVGTLTGNPAAPRKLLPYLTVGSTREEVLALQGTPTASTENKLVYGSSELYLKENRVIGWRIDSASSPIRVKLWPSVPVDPALTYYSAGSTKDAVLAVQGTPTAFTEDSFEYGKSEVSFRNNRVVSWKEDPASVPLWAR